MSRNKVCFDLDLIDHITSGRIDEAKSMLDCHLVMASDKFGTLLHYAAVHGRAIIAKHLIDMGSIVDSVGKDNKTPIILALERRSLETIEVLLDAGAKIDINDQKHKKAVEIAFEFIFRKIRAAASSLEESIEKLLEVGFSVDDAVRFEDFEVVRGLLQLNWKDKNGDSALYNAVKTENFKLMELLIDYGADVNEMDEYGDGPLIFAAGSKNPAILQFLLERGANPNMSSPYLGNSGIFNLDEFYNYKTPLSATFISLRKGDGKKVRKCAEILLQHGAFPPDLRLFLNFLLQRYTHERKNFNVFNCLIAQLAVNETINRSTAVSIMRRLDANDHPNMFKLQDYYKKCEQLLKINVFETTSLLDLLADKEYKTRLRVRNEKFVSEVKKACALHDLNKLHHYYYVTLMKRISKAERRIKFENKAIPIICQIFQKNHNECYIAARQILTYLSDRDIENMCKM